MSHPFGDLISQHLHRRHGLSQSKLAAGILQSPAVITAMCQGRRLRGPQARERVVAIIAWLHRQAVLSTHEEANALLNAAGMSSLDGSRPEEAKLARSLGNAPTTPTRTTPQSPKHNLPTPANPVLGRDADVDAVSKLLKQSDVRLVTLVGPPGVGKTRLALEIAMRAGGSIVNEVCWVELAPVTDPHIVLTTIMRALEVEEQSGRPAQRVLQDYLRDKSLLLVLDNLEQVLDAAPHISQLLSAAPKTKVLATSRESLRIAGEHSHIVNPLAEDAVALFVQRAQAIKPSFVLTSENAAIVERICHDLDGLPLAIELAAARIGLFTPQEILSRLNRRLSLLTSGARDLPARQRTLRATLDWSYELLTPHEQTLFRRLGVFAGGFTLEAAQVFCDIDGIPLTAVDGITALVDKNLLSRREDRTGGSRFFMLETMREYANEKLREHGEFAKWTENLGWYLVTKAEQFRRKEYRTLYEESDNWRATMLSLQTREAADELELLLASQCEIYESELQYMQQMLDKTISRPQTSQSLTPARMEAYRHMCYVDAGVNNLKHAKQAGVEFMRLCDALGYTGVVIPALYEPASIARESGDVMLARSIFSKQFALAQMYGYTEDAINSRVSLGEVEVVDENPIAAIALLDQAEELLARSGIEDQIYILGTQVWTSNHRGHAAQLQQDYDHARKYYAQSLSHATEFQSLIEWKGLAPTAFGWNYHGLGETDLSDGKTTEAAGWFRKALHLGDGNLRGTVLAWCLAGLAGVYTLDEDPERGAKLWGASEALREQIGCRIAPASRLNRERTVALLREQLGNDEFMRLTAEGAKISVDEAVAFALETS